MNRREFVNSLGTSMLFSALGLKNGPIIAARNAEALSFGNESALSASVERPEFAAWPRPDIVPIPTEVAGVVQPVTDLGGEWKFSLVPPGEFWADRVDPAPWANVMVPGELTAQDMPIARDSE